MKTTRLYLIRHGQSENNARPESERVHDPELTPLGNLQAIRLAKHLAKSDIRHLFTSGFLRALQTTQFLSDALSLIPRVRWDLFEQGGCYSGHEAIGKVPQPGLGSVQLKQFFPGWEIDHRISDRGWWHGQSHETPSQARRRAELIAIWTIERLQTAPESIALVIHADLIHLLLDALIEDGIYPLENLANTSVTILNWSDKRLRLESLNDTTHLDSSQITY